MLMDLPVSPGQAGKRRQDWGLQNMSTMDHPNRAVAANNAHRLQNVRRKIQHFADNAVYPQQLTIPRQYSTTKEGVSIFKVLKGRVIDGHQEDGVRLVVQENAKLARFIMSPLFASEFDAQTWARQQMGMK